MTDSTTATAAMRWGRDPDATLGDLPSVAALDAALAKAVAYAYLLLATEDPQEAEDYVRNRLVAIHSADTQDQRLDLVQSALDAGRAGFMARLRRQLVREEATETRLGLIGRDRVLVDKVAAWAHRELATRGEHTPLVDTPYGATFEVKVGGAGEPASHVVSVSVELDRVEPPPRAHPQ
ncbi:MAG: hypothetical protein JWM47_2839 [Acidimicrobiales bacterium]|nr:hypothetical protein [Acidimicrobiales bacterium]